jgi:uncharacterized phage protein gp47/JayE
MIVTPTAQESSDQILADIEGELGQSTPILPKAFIRVLAKALGGAIALLYRYARWIYDQIFPATADAEALLRIGAQYDMAPTPSVEAVIDITIVGDTGAEVPANTIWRGNNGLTYSQIALAVISGGTATARLQCMTGGADGSLGTGNTLEASSPVAGVTGGYVTEIITEGEDAETTEQFRLRVMQRVAGQPQGGSAADYIRWTLQIPGIVKAFAFRTDAGEVTVYPLVAITGADRIPAAGKLTEVQAYLQNPSIRPLCATVLAAACTERTVDVTITGIDPADASTKAEIVAALEAYFYERYPRQYPDELNPTHVLSVAAIWAAIMYAGAAATSLTMSVSGTGAATRYELGDGEICKLGTVTWA